MIIVILVTGNHQYLLDASDFIAQKNRSLSMSSWPDQLVLSVVSHAEPSAAALAAADVDVRARRLVTRRLSQK